MHPEDTPEGKAAIETVAHCMAMARTLARALECEAEASNRAWRAFHSYQLVAENISALLETVHAPIVEVTAGRAKKAG